MKRNPLFEKIWLEGTIFWRIKCLVSCLSFWALYSLTETGIWNRCGVRQQFFRIDELLLLVAIFPPVFQKLSPSCYSLLFCRRSVVCSYYTQFLEFTSLPSSIIHFSLILHCHRLIDCGKPFCFCLSCLEYYRFTLTEKQTQPVHLIYNGYIFFFWTLLIVILG